MRHKREEGLAMPDKAAAQRAIVLEIDGVIGPAVANYIVRELRTVARGEAGLIVLRINTPSPALSQRF
jgi:membrane-bound serine protease (ClpP class)